MNIKQSHGVAVLICSVVGLFSLAGLFVFIYGVTGGWFDDVEFTPFVIGGFVALPIGVWLPKQWLSGAAKHLVRAIVFTLCVAPLPLGPEGTILPAAFGILCLPSLFIFPQGIISVFITVVCASVGLECFGIIRRGYGRESVSDSLVEKEGGIVLGDRVAGLVVGTAVGDALGLVREGLSRSRAYKMYGDRPIGNRFIFGCGMISDDTEHTCMVVQSLLVSKGEVGLFERDFARRLKFWLLGVPAGIGLATLRSILNLLIGLSPSNSGVYSAGNGPAMRSAVLGVYTGENVEKLKELVRASTRITHTDPKAFEGAFAISLCAQYASGRSQKEFATDDIFELLRKHLSDADILELLGKVERGLEEGVSSEQMADSLGFNKGVGGYIVHTVPMAVFCWLKNIGDFRGAVEDVILLGGDADTTGAIVGALAGVTLGESSIPREWVESIKDYPCSIDFLEKLSWQLAEQIEDDGCYLDRQLLGKNFISRIPRNMFFAAVVLGYGFRRLLPPY